MLDLAVTSIERWSQVKSSRFGEAPPNYWSGFLSETSYSDVHTTTDLRYPDSERILLDAVEAAIVHHASTQSLWWQSNRERVCFSTEGALRYFATLACAAAPTANLEVIGRLLCDKVLLESGLSYELGTLIQMAFLHLDSATQDAIQTTLLTLRQEITSDPRHRAWMLQEQAQLIVAIPCYLRSAEAQAVLDECEKFVWPFVRRPDIRMSGGWVSPPFSFEVFLDASDDTVVRLLDHYEGHARNSFDDFLVGGESEVGCQLREAASRHPSRFVNLLSANWAQISGRFRDDLMEGIATYLAHQYGSLQANGAWSPKENPDTAVLVKQILDELERHPSHWHHNRAASKAIESCAHVVAQVEDAARLVSLATDFSTLQEESSISGDSVDLISIGINMSRGNAAEALIILANQLEEKDVPWPELLPNALRLFSADKHPAIRALLLRRMPYFQRHHLELGWELFGLTMRENAPGLWFIAEPCLYYGYRQSFEIVAPWLARLHREGSGKDLETWGRISALAALSKQLDFAAFLAELKAKEAIEASRGAASVWAHPSNIQQHREHCLAGLEVGLDAENLHALAVAHKFRRIFREITPLVAVPIELIRRCFCLLETETDSARSDIFGFDAWLNAMSLRDPMYTLEVAEIYFDFVQRTKSYVYDHENNITQLLTRLFAQAEEQEELDGGAMLRRVVAAQDTLLALEVNSMTDWLIAAERP